MTISSKVPPLQQARFQLHRRPPASCLVQRLRNSTLAQGVAPLSPFFSERHPYFLQGGPLWPTVVCEADQEVHATFMGDCENEDEHQVVLGSLGIDRRCNRCFRERGRQRHQLWGDRGSSGLLLDFPGILGCAGMHHLRPQLLVRSVVRTRPGHVCAKPELRRQEILLLYRSQIASQTGVGQPGSLPAGCSLLVHGGDRIDSQGSLCSMSWIQRIVTAVLPRRWAESMEAHWISAG